MSSLTRKTQDEKNQDQIRTKLRCLVVDIENLVIAPCKSASSLSKKARRTIIESLEDFLDEGCFEDEEWVPDESHDEEEEEELDDSISPIATEKSEDDSGILDVREVPRDEIPVQPNLRPRSSPIPIPKRTDSEEESESEWQIGTPRQYKNSLSAYLQ